VGGYGLEDRFRQGWRGGLCFGVVGVSKRRVSGSQLGCKR